MLTVNLEAVMNSPSPTFASVDAPEDVGACGSLVGVKMARQRLRPDDVKL